MKGCVHAAKKNPRKWKKCQCPVWVQGTLRGQWIKKTLGIRNWESAQRIIREWEAGAISAIVMKDACDRFYADGMARGLGEAHLGKYRLIMAELKNWFGERAVSGITSDELREYRESWKMAPVSAAKKLERVRSFFKFCLESAWIGSNPARMLKPPKVKASPTLPFTEGELVKIFAAIEKYPVKGIYGEGNRTRLQAMTLLLRYSGLRIGDAACLRTDALKGDKLFVTTQKTGVKVFLPLPDFVVKALDKVKGDEFVFWSGEGNKKSTVGDWQRSFRKLFEIAKIEGNPHRFRDTFAVDLLSHGVSIEHVSVLLGHSSIRVTEKHYAPWVKSRQESLERDVRRIWQS
jgi:integrase